MLYNINLKGWAMVNDNKNLSRLTFTLDSNQAELFMQQAKEQGLRMNTLLRLIISNFINNKKALEINIPLSANYSGETSRLTFTMEADQAEKFDKIAKLLDLKRNSLLKLLVMDFINNNKVLNIDKPNTERWD